MSQFFKYLKLLVVVLCFFSAILHVILKQTGNDLMKSSSMLAKIKVASNSTVTAPTRNKTVLIMDTDATYNGSKQGSAETPAIINEQEDTGTEEISQEAKGTEADVISEQQHTGTEKIALAAKPGTTTILPILDPSNPTEPPITINDIADIGNTTYVLPNSGDPDPIPVKRVMAAFPQPKESDPGWKIIFEGNNTGCEITSQIVITRRDLMGAEPAVDSKKWWMLSTFDQHGSRKTIGGDEIYVTYTANGQEVPTAIALVTDLRNGDYQLEFVSSPILPASTILSNLTETTGVLSVVLEHSCHIGYLAPPNKKSWPTMGAINQFYKVNNIAAPLSISQFRHPNLNGSIDLNHYHAVAVVGDSMVGDLVCRRHFDGCPPIRHRMAYSMIQAPLNTRTVSSHFLLPVRAALQKFRPRHADDPLALIVGSGVWDILADADSAGGHNFEDHLEACRMFISSTQAAFPNLSIFWKSMTAMHIHRVASNQDWEHIQRVYYMSNSRARQLYELQKTVMKEFNVTVLDVFAATYLSAHQTIYGDGRHYMSELNELTLSYFYP